MDSSNTDVSVNGAFLGIFWIAIIRTVMELSESCLGFDKTVCDSTSNLCNPTTKVGLRYVKLVPVLRCEVPRLESSSIIIILVIKFLKYFCCPKPTDMCNPYARRHDMVWNYHLTSAVGSNISSHETLADETSLVSV
jgi:hypothetical protein